LPYKVVLTALAAQDFRSLDGSVKEQGARQLRKLETAPRLGEHLGKRGDLDLTDYYKPYAARNAIRIVYRISEVEVVVEVIAIGQREDFAVYREAVRSILKS
jgi:mRNA-degrading endonuclease RelE of RelBE toxin-antitoxin system